MAKSKKKSKKLITQDKEPNVKKVAFSRKSKPSLSKAVREEKALVFGRENYKWVGIGLAFIAVGMLLMIGGFNENPNVWDEGSIYSMRRILLAPLVILAGLAIQIYAIFR